MAAPPTSREWAHLDSISLIEISKFLHSRVDKLHMRAVCTSWRYYCPFPAKTSFLLLPFPIAPHPRIDPNRKGHYVLNESTVYGFQPLKKILNSFGTPKTWIVKIEENCFGQSPGKAKLIKPLYKFAVLNPEPWPKVLNSLDYRVTEISKDYYAAFLEYGEGQVPRMKDDACYVIEDFAVSKPFNGSNDGLAVMALHNETELAVWRSGEKKWSLVNLRKGSYYVHAAFFNGLFYAIEYNGSTITVDPVSLKVTHLVTAMDHDVIYYAKYLLKSFGNMFMIHKYGMDSDDVCNENFDEEVMYPFKVKVYKLNEGKKEWVPVKELKDRVLFASDKSCSFSIMTKDFVGLRGNCVFYLHKFFLSEYAGVFDLEEDVTLKVAEEPSFSKIFWPPPAWIKKESTVPRN